MVATVALWLRVFVWPSLCLVVTVAQFVLVKNARLHDMQFEVCLSSRGRTFHVIGWQTDMGTSWL